MSEVTTIGLDIAKHVFHAHGADERGGTVFSRRLTRGKLLDFFARQGIITLSKQAVDALLKACAVQPER